MSKFNKGKAYVGTTAIEQGRLRGATDKEDHFYFFCPNCPDDQIMRILEYGVHAQEKENPYNVSFKTKAPEGFTLAFKVHCEECNHTDFFKITNTGWQGGKHKDVLG